MEKQQAEEKIQQLSAELEQHNHNYYVLDKPTISDFEFDKLLEELIALEKQFPELLLPTSPSQRVGGNITKEFKTVKHKYPMLSLGNTYNEMELKEFDERVKKGIENQELEYVCEQKFDGVAISLTYVDGLLKKAVTRGDGVQGDDVTTNVKTIKTIPLKINKANLPSEFEVRGEVFFSRETFDKINKEREDIGEPLLANPRNSASGTLKMQDSSIVAKRNLDCYMYFLLGEDLPFRTHLDSLKALKDWGFNVSDTYMICKDIIQVLEYIKVWETKRYDLDRKSVV